jgi:hypothetical protein
VKAQRAYLDTNAFRYFGVAFERAKLPEDLRDKLLISPLSAFEAFAQLADEDQGDTVLRQIHAIRNWTNPKRSGLLPWPDEWLYQLWFQKQRPDEKFTKQMEYSFNLCLTSDSAATINAEAAMHNQVMDDFKLSVAQDFKNMVDAARNEKTKAFDMTGPWFRGIARRAGADANSKPESEIVSALSAYHEFEQNKLKTALKFRKYNPLSRTNQNDIIDAEQLVYLADPSLCMITADRGFKSKVTKSDQAARIITISADDLMDARKAEAVLKRNLT